MNVSKKRNALLLFNYIPVFLCVLIIVCQPVPFTQRKQLTLIPTSQLFALSFQSYSQLLQQNTLVTGTQSSEMLKRTGRNIQQSVERYARENNLEERLQGFEWEFTLIKEDAANAFCMPGGKVGVFTGILPIAKNETGLAVVLGHEIAHAIAEHGNERMSQALLIQLGGIALAQALQEEPEQTQALFLAAYGLGAQVGIQLPFSRLHEIEADKLGLIFMAMAGYNPQAAIGFWTRMQQASDTPQPPELLSTHPPYQERIRALRDFMPEAMKYYQQ